MQYEVPIRKVPTAPYCNTPISIQQLLSDKCHTFLAANTDNSLTGTIRISDHGQLTCDFLVLAVLKSLVQVGETPYEELAIACRELFLQILHANNEYITVGMMLKCLSNDTYEKAQLSKVIKNIAAEVNS